MNELSDWVKSRLKQGYSLDQLKLTLLKQGYSHEQIEGAMSKDSLLLPFVKSSYYLLALFVFSFLFIHYAFDMLKEGLVHLFILLLLGIVIDKLYQLNKTKVGLTIAIIIIVLSNYLLLNYIIILALVLSVIYSLTYYFKYKNRYNFILTSTISLISIFLSFVLTFIIFVITSYGFSLILGVINLLTSSLILSPLLFVFFLSYLFLSARLSTKILNKPPVNLTVLFKTSLIIFIVLILIIHISFLVSRLKTVEETYRQMSVTVEESLTGMDNKLRVERYGKMIKLKGYSDIRNTVVLRIDNKLTYPTQLFSDTKTLFYDCDTSLNCKSEPIIDLENIFEDKVPKQEITKLIIGTSLSTKDIFILPEESYEEMIARDIFEFESESLKDTKIAKEINKLNKEQYNDLLAFNINMPSKLKDKIWGIYTLNVIDSFADYIELITKLGLSIGNNRQLVRITLAEYKWIERNQINNTFFYDNAENMQEHISNLRTNIDYFYPDLPESTKSNIYDSLLGVKSNSIFSIESESLYQTILMQLTNHLKVIKTFERLGENLASQKKKYSEEIYQMYKDKDISKDDIDKIIRLKILETRIAEKVGDNCETEECGQEIMSRTHNPWVCRSLYHLNSDECIINYAYYDKLICDEKYSPKEECLANANLCIESWTCGDWSSCTEQGSQTRTCTDSNSCDTTANNPAITKSCTYVEPVQQDNVKNNSIENNTITDKKYVLYLYVHNGVELGLSEEPFILYEIPGNEFIEKPKFHHRDLDEVTCSEDIEFPTQEITFWGPTGTDSEGIIYKKILINSLNINEKLFDSWVRCSTEEDVRQLPPGAFYYEIGSDINHDDFWDRLVIETIN
jgi:hypothetical protein